MATYEEFMNQLRERNQQQRPLTSQEMNSINKTEEAKEANIKIKDRGIDNFQRILIYILVGFLVIGGITAFLIYDGKVGFNSSLICGNVTSNCPNLTCPDNQLSCPTVTCPPCNLSCDFPNKIEVVLNQTN